MTPAECRDMGDNKRPVAMFVMDILISLVCWWRWDWQIAALVFLGIFYVTLLQAHIVWGVRKVWERE